MEDVVLLVNMALVLVTTTIFNAGFCTSHNSTIQTISEQAVISWLKVNNFCHSKRVLLTNYLFLGSNSITSGMENALFPSEKNGFNDPDVCDWYTAN